MSKSKTVKTVKSFGDGSVLIEGLNEKRQMALVALAAPQTRALRALLVEHGIQKFVRRNTVLHHTDTSMTVEINALADRRTKFGDLVMTSLEAELMLKNLVKELNARRRARKEQ